MSLALSRLLLLLTATLLMMAAAAGAQTVEELLGKGDVFDRKFAADEALKFYLTAERLDPTDVRVLLRVARQYRHLMADASAKTEKLRLGHVALGYAQRAAALAPNDAEAQLSIAIT